MTISIYSLVYRMLLRTVSLASCRAGTVTERGFALIGNVLHRHVPSETRLGGMHRLPHQRPCGTGRSSPIRNGPGPEQHRFFITEEEVEGHGGPRRECAAWLVRGLSRSTRAPWPSVALACFLRGEKRSCPPTPGAGDQPPAVVARLDSVRHDEGAVACQREHAPADRLRNSA